MSVRNDVFVNYLNCLTAHSYQALAAFYKLQIFSLLNRQKIFTNANVKAVRLHKGLIDAAFYLGSK